MRKRSASLSLPPSIRQRIHMGSTNPHCGEQSPHVIL